MSECFICGVSGEKKRLFNAITEEGVQEVCEQCALDEHLPLVRRPTTFQLKEAERPQTIYERLSKQAGINSVQHRNRPSLEVQESMKKQRQELIKEEVKLKDIVEKNLKLGNKKETRPREDLIDNFHWDIMMGRRKMHITTKQLADAISESEVVIKMAEQGMLPEDDYRLINKLENYLGIRIKKSNQIIFNTKYNSLKPPARVLNFKPRAIENLTIADIKTMKASLNNVEKNKVNGLDLNVDEIEDIKEDEFSD